MVSRIYKNDVSGITILKYININHLYDEYIKSFVRRVSPVFHRPLMIIDYNFKDLFVKLCVYNYNISTFIKFLNLSICYSFSVHISRVYYITYIYSGYHTRFIVPVDIF